MGGGEAEYLQSTTVHLESIRTRCFRYFRKTGSPPHDFFFKTFQKSKSSDFQFYLGEMKNFPYRCNDNKSVFNTINNTKQENVTFIRYGGSFISLLK